MWVWPSALRCLGLVSATLLLASACRADTSAVDLAVAEPIVASVDSELVEVMAGRDAIAAAQGEPHILWFWGAH